MAGSSCAPTAMPARTAAASSDKISASSYDLIVDRTLKPLAEERLKAFEDK